MAMIDFTAQMAPCAMVLVALLVIAGAGIGSCIDSPEREKMRASAQRVGAWWVGRDAARDVDSAKPSPGAATSTRLLHPSGEAAQG